MRRCAVWPKWGPCEPWIWFRQGWYGIEFGASRVTSYIVDHAGLECRYGERYRGQHGNSPGWVSTTEQEWKQFG